MTDYRDFPTRDELREAFDYRDDGALINIGQHGGRAADGEVAGNLNIASNRWCIGFKGGKYLRHNLVWCWHKPGIRVGYVIDHKKSGWAHRMDDRIENLREVSKSLDILNSRAERGGSSQYRGVTRLANGRWRAKIKVWGEDYALGNYPPDAEAHAAAAYEHAREFIDTHFGAYERAPYWRELPRGVTPCGVGWKKLLSIFGIEEPPIAPPAWT